MSTIPGSDAVNWIIGPVGQCIKLIGEATTFPSLLHRAVVTLEGQPVFLELARQQAMMRKNHRALAALAKYKVQAADASAVAREHIDTDFDSINKFAVIGLWVPIEVSVEDTCILVLSKSSSSQRLIEHGFKVKRWDGALTEAEARAVWRKLERQARESSTVVEAYARILESLGLSISLDQSTEQTLSELNYVRNCVLHRAGIVDDRAQAQAPLLGIAPGEILRVSSVQYARYIDGAHRFALSLLNATLKSEYVRLSSPS